MFFGPVARRIRLNAVFVGALVVTSCLGPRLSAQIDAFEEEPIEYSKTRPRDLIARLQRRIQLGYWRPRRDVSDVEFLRELLRELKVPESSQVLVFSKTSQQNPRISPRTPRAIYFSDDCYVGWVQGGAIELTGIDPQLGPIFWVLDISDAKKQLKFDRDGSCLLCHAGSRTRRTPGLIVRSVFPNRQGFPIFSASSFLSTHASPFEERWGGWYVTGTHGSQRHMGNVIAKRDERGVSVDREAGANVESLDSYFNTSRYLAKTSDIVALMVLEHQVAVQNVLTRASYRTRQAVRYQRDLEDGLGRETSSILSGSSKRIVDAAARELCDVLLFRNEAKLEGRVRGTRAFREDFSKRARRSLTGTSLRDLELRSRLFRYRLSYLIYSKSFDQMPDPLKERVVGRIRQVLSGQDSSGRYDYIGVEERGEITAILTVTKPELVRARVGS
ncbi:MAG: hypothetical protein AAF517_14805 [Planctomycetota bacterium]